MIARSELAPIGSTTCTVATCASPSATPVQGWLRYADSEHQPATPFAPDVPTAADDPLLLYFTSGTTALPKLVEHTHVSYPVGHLSTMYWIGLQPGDVHLNVSSPGLGQARLVLRVRAVDRRRHDLPVQLRPLRRRRRCWTCCATRKVTTFCAPPTVWRMLIQQDLAAWRDALAARAGRRGRAAQPRGDRAGAARPGGSPSATGSARPRSSLQIGNSPGQPLKLGSMGRPMPGFEIALVDPATDEIGATRARSASTSSPSAGRADGRLPRTTTSATMPRSPAGATTPATSPAATPTATSPTSAAPTTCSRPATTGSARSSSRAC